MPDYEAMILARQEAWEISEECEDCFCRDDCQSRWGEGEEDE